MNIGLAGFGNVGKALVQILQNQQEKENITLKFILDSRGGICDNSGLNMAEILNSGIKTHKNYIKGLTIDQVLENTDIDYLAELTPTNKQTGEPGLSNMIKAIDRGIHVVTGNKGPIMLQYASLKEKARQKGVHLGIGCTAGGALPTINAGIYDLSGGRLKSFEAILNGTSNFILSKMTQENESYHTALKKAQDMGIAESDPSYDVEGYDTALKTLIIANAILGTELQLKDIAVSGIQHITPEIIQKAKDKGLKIKLTGKCSIDETGHIQIETKPVELGPENPLYHIEGKDKGIFYQTDIFGDLFISGGSSDPYSAGGAVYRDIINIEKGWGY